MSPNAKPTQHICGSYEIPMDDILAKISALTTHPQQPKAQDSAKAPASLRGGDD